MLGDISQVEHIYLACGYTDLRRGIDGLAQIVQQRFSLDPFSNSLFLFCGRRRDRIKALLWEGDGFVLLNKRMENGGGFQWPRTWRQPLRMSPLLADFIHARVCKPICEKSLTRPDFSVKGVVSLGAYY